MRRSILQKSTMLTFVVAGILAIHPVYADKPPGSGGGRGEKHERQTYGHPNKHEDSQWDREGHGDHDRHDQDIGERGHFDARQRAYINDYYAEQFRSGHCPPGLAKKHNGCFPPGQAKKWAIGRPLPHDVQYYDLPASVAMQFGIPPAGYRYVRVANDILLMATGTRMILDAITDLGGR